MLRDPYGYWREDSNPVPVAIGALLGSTVWVVANSLRVDFWDGRRFWVNIRCKKKASRRKAENLITPRHDPVRLFFDWL